MQTGFWWVFFVFIDRSTRFESGLCLVMDDENGFCRGFLFFIE